MGDQVKRPMSRLWSLMVDWKKFRFRITFKLILPVYDALKPSNCSRTPSFINKMLCLNRSASPLDKTLTLMKARVRAQVSFEEELDEMRWDEIHGQERPHHFNRFQLHNHTIKPRRNVKFLTEKCGRKQFEFSCEKGLENQQKCQIYTKMDCLRQGQSNWTAPSFFPTSQIQCQHNRGQKNCCDYAVFN